jgi:hypothetical protein
MRRSNNIQIKDVKKGDKFIIKKIPPYSCLHIGQVVVLGKIFMSDYVKLGYIARLYLEGPGNFTHVLWSNLKKSIIIKNK